MLDLERDEEAALAARLIKGADLLVSDWREGERMSSELPLGDPDRWGERFPETTFVSISDFGMTGPYASWHADSHIIEGLAGFSYVSGDPDASHSRGHRDQRHFAATHADDRRARRRPPRRGGASGHTSSTSPRTRR